MKKAFLLGAAGYPLLEMIFRGRTHPSMALAGGLGCAAICRAGRMPLSLVSRAALGGLSVTAIEAACGLVWNRHHQVWDYRRVPLNWRGQVCLPYTVLWSLLAGGMIALQDTAKH